VVAAYSPHAPTRERANPAYKLPASSQPIERI
jgi:hypothetical protein